MENSLSLQHLLPSSLCVCGIKAVPLYSALLGSWRTGRSFPHCFSDERCLVEINVRLHYFNESPQGDKSSLRAASFAAWRRMESIPLFWEGETSGKEEQWCPFACGSSLLCVIFCSSLTLMCEHFCWGYFPIRKSSINRAVCSSLNNFFFSLEFHFPQSN